MPLCCAGAVAACTRLNLHLRFAQPVFCELFAWNQQSTTSNKPTQRALRQSGVRALLHFVADVMEKGQTIGGRPSTKLPLLTSHSIVIAKRTHSSPPTARETQAQALLPAQTPPVQSRNRARSRGRHQFSMRLHAFAHALGAPRARAAAGR